MTPIVLASGSPRRRDLLEGLGLTFAVEPVEVDERPRAGETPAALVARLSSVKAQWGVDRHPGALVIAADTVVVVDGRGLGKPVDAAEGARFLVALAGRTHSVLTGHTLARDSRRASVTVRTEVTFRELDPAEIGRYVGTGEGLDKAGGYAIQGRGAALVERVEGCYFNVVGLSLSTVVCLARRLGVALV